MPTCPNCYVELLDCHIELEVGFEADFICKNCKHFFTKDDLIELQCPWYKHVCADDSLWQREVFDEYPCIIAHEYRRLYDLLEKGQTYGVLLQMKDIFEVLIKFPTLVLASVIFGKRERSDEENKILIALMGKIVPLGAWERIAQTMYKKVNRERSISYIQDNIVTMFKKYKIREWRNETIGHGALAFDDNDDFQRDIKDKLKLIKTHFQECAQAYALLKFYLLVQEQQVVLYGWKQATNLNYPVTSELFIQIGEEFKHTLSPYILLKDRKIYFFDHYIPKDEKTSILNYPEGDKRYIHSDELTRFYSKRVKDSALEQFVSSFDDETYPALEVKTLDKIAAVDDFQSPKYLIKWIKELFKKHSKGIFLLQMERGMGKSMFARALDQQFMYKIHLDNFTVRSYYINDTYLYKVGVFTSSISRFILAGGDEIHGNLPVLSIHSEHKCEDFADLLNFYRKAHQTHFGKEKLLFIIDGLDEIPAGENFSIFDFIPEPDFFDDGVYLLLTCRTDKEISRFTVNKLHTITVTEGCGIGRDDQKHIRVLRAYINKQFGRMSDQEKQTILDKAENRFLYLKMIKESLKSAQIQGPDIMHFLIGNSSFDTFLDNLQFAYGEKFFEGVIKILSILSTAFVPLTLREISYLFGEERPTFKLLAHLIDLRGFLKAESSYRGHVISIAHSELKELVVEKYRLTIQKLLQRWVEDHIPIEVEKIDIENDGRIYLLTYLLHYVTNYAPHAREKSFSIVFADQLFALAVKLQETSLIEHHRERTIYLYTDVIEIQRTLLATGTLQDEQVLAKTLLNRGIAYTTMRRLEDAIVDYTRAIELQQRLFDNGRLQDKNSLARAYVNRGEAYGRIHKVQKAIADFDCAIVLQQGYLETGALQDEHELAVTQGYRGIAYMQSHKMQEALADFNRAITLLQQLQETGKLPDENHLARVLMNRATAYGWLQKIQEAITDFTKVIEIQQKLLSTGKLMNENELARVFVNRGIAYNIIRKRQEAIYDYNQAIGIQERLWNEGELLDEYELAWTLMNRGEIYTQLQQIEEAVADFNRAILIQQELVKTRKLINENELALAFVNRGIAYMQKKQIRDAITDFDRAIAQQQELLATGQLFDEGELAWTLIHRGIAYRDEQQIQKALTDFDLAITIQQRLQKAGMLLDEHDLALAFMNRGIAYHAGQKVQEAFDDLSRASDITKNLLSNNPFLIETYAQVSFHLLSVGKRFGGMEEFERLKMETHEIFKSYELTKEAEYWHSAIQHLLSTTI